jgi:hypothetical protein
VSFVAISLSMYMLQAVLGFPRMLISQAVLIPHEHERRKRRSSRGHECVWEDVTLGVGSL